MKKLLLITTTLFLFTFANITYAEVTKQQTIDYIMKKAKKCDNTYNVLGEKMPKNLFISIKDDIIIHDIRFGSTHDSGLSRETMPLSSLKEVKLDGDGYVRIYSDDDDVIDTTYETINNGSQRITSCRGSSCNPNINSSTLGNITRTRNSNSIIFWKECSSVHKKKLTKAFNHLIKLLNTDKKNEVELF